MKTNHTPGPWEIGYTDDNKTPVITAEARDICTMETYFGDEEANARLIAAAPDLLVALEKCSALLDAVIVAGKCAAFADLTESPMGNIIDPASEARAAIAKATTPQP